MKKPLLRLLTLTENFVPKGGSITWMLNTYSRFDPREVIVVASPQKGDSHIDQVLLFRVVRIPMLMADWDPTVPASLMRYLHIVGHVYRQYHTYCGRPEAVYRIRQKHHLGAAFVLLTVGRIQGGKGRRRSSRLSS